MDDIYLPVDVNGKEDPNDSDDERSSIESEEELSLGEISEEELSEQEEQEELEGELPKGKFEEVPMKGETLASMISQLLKPPTQPSPGAQSIIPSASAHNLLASPGIQPQIITQASIRPQIVAQAQPQIITQASIRPQIVAQAQPQVLLSPRGPTLPPELEVFQRMIIPVDPEPSLNSLLIKESGESDHLFNFRSQYALGVKARAPSVKPETAVLLGKLVANTAVLGTTYPKETETSLAKVDQWLRSIG